MSIFIIYKAWEIDGRREVASRTEENYSKNQGLYVKSSTTNGRKNMKGLVENIEKKVFMYSWIWVLVYWIINAL